MMLIPALALLGLLLVGGSTLVAARRCSSAAASAGVIFQSGKDLIHYFLQPEKSV